MAFEHSQYGLGTATTAAVMQRIWTFVTASAVVRFVQDGGVASVSFNGTDYSAATPVLSPTSPWADNSYMVVEPVNEYYVGGGRWQVKIQRLTVSSIKATTDFNGTWASKAFNATTGCLTVATTVFPGSPSAEDSLHLTASNADTYDGGTRSYSYLRLLRRSPATAEDVSFVTGLYVGGYIPCSPGLDVRPACMLAYQPVLATGSANYWGSSVGASRIPVEYGHTTRDLTSVGICMLASFNQYYLTQATINIHTTPTGAWVNSPILILSASALRGTFGSYTMEAGSIARADGTVDSTGKWMVVHGMMMRIAA